MKKYKLAAALLACVLASMPLSEKTVRAEGNNYSQLIDSVQIKSYLVLKKNAPVPNVTFHYTLSPGQKVDATDSTHEILPGPPNAVIASSSSLRFSPEDASAPEASAPSGSSISFATPDDKSDEVYVEKTLTVDLKNVEFTAAGIYRYVLTEQALTETGVIPDSRTQRFIDVYVQKSDRTDEDTYDPGIAIVRLNSAVPDAEGKTPESVKSTGFTNRYSTNDLGFSKSITGNQASVNKYFKFTVRLTESITENSGDNRVKVSGEFTPQPQESMATLYDADVMAAANDVQGYVTLSQLKEGKDFYIKGGESIQLTGIPAGLGYEVAEVAEDYTPSVKTEGDPDYAESDGKVSDTLTEDTTLAFLNTLDGVIPSTGITAAFAIPAAAMLAGIAGIIFLIAKRLRRIKQKASEGN
jgi:hypothetical protein